MQRTSAEIHDEWLVLRFQSGDAAALPELHSRWNRRLHCHARRLVVQSSAADDVVQEAWLAIVRGLWRLDDPARFGPWAYRIVTNKCRDWMRRRVRERSRGLEGTGGSIGLKEAQAAGCIAEAGGLDATGEAAERDAELGAVRAAIRELPCAQWAALALHYLEGLSVAEVAVAMGVPPGTIKSRLHHARERLRAKILHNERSES